jgi:hypothetical protein
MSLKTDSVLVTLHTIFFVNHQLFNTQRKHYMHYNITLMFLNYLR